MDIKNTILGLLDIKPMTGYELKEVFDTALGYFSGASFGSIYPTLRKLEAGGLARVKTETCEGRHRKVYFITPLGKKAFQKSLSSELRIPPFRNEFLARLFFFSFLKPHRRVEVVKEYINYLRNKRAALKSLEQTVKTQADPYQAMCYRFGLRLVDNFIENTSQVLAELRAHDGNWE